MEKLTYALASVLTLMAPIAPAPAQDREDVAAKNAGMVARYYPAGALRRGEEGSVEFRVVLDREAKITSCAVTRSSGFAELDERTCDLMVETAQFAIIRDASGWRAGSTHDGRIVWRLPDDAVLPNGAATPRSPRRIYAGDRIVCRHQFKQGSLYVTEKICLSRDDWRRQIDYSQAAVQAMQSPAGPLM